MGKSRITYLEPKDRFSKINIKVIENYDIEIVGIYCKLVRLSSGKSLDMDFISEKTGVKEKRLRRFVVLLESEGYITRTPIKGEKGKFIGWNYLLHAEPVEQVERTHAGKSDLTSSGLDQKRTSPSADKSVSGKDIISIKDNSYNNIDNISSEHSSSDNVNIDSVSVETPHACEEEVLFVQRMKERFPRIMKLEKPLTLEQAKKLKTKYGADLLAKVMTDLENHKPLLKKYVKAEATINNWCLKEVERT